MSNYFTDLAGVDCSAHVEKKGRYSYLSWTHAVAELLKRHPESTWTVYEHDGSPYKETPAGCFVKVGVVVNGIERVQWHPVLGDNNRPIEKPNCFQVNTSVQRALVKAIALHGLGLSIYAGEDVPNGDGSDEIRPEPKSAATPRAWLSANAVTKKHPALAKLVEKGWEWEPKIAEWLAQDGEKSVAEFARFVDGLGVKG